ncbi:TadE/TadG family type IV pilus assembly protein [Botrimarina sp.]|uniref:TadE/TadG family type IV pilus assembly protein n=1 Tax=Botrimarina sp. TaxID=2795802 RepID=UPI0032F0123C
MNRPATTRRRGLAATEFAVCLPVLMLLLLGSLECCSMIFLKQSISVAAYEGAHKALLPGATAAEAEAAAMAVLADRGVRGGQATAAGGNLGAVAAGDYFTVVVSAPTDQNRVVPLRFFGASRLSATATFMKEF